MDEAQLVFYDGVSSLLDQHIHPVSGEATVLKLKSTLAAIEVPAPLFLSVKILAAVSKGVDLPIRLATIHKTRADRISPV